MVAPPELRKAVRALRRARRLRPANVIGGASPLFVLVPAGRTLFDEGLHALERSFVHHVAGHALTPWFIRGCDPQFALLVKKFLPHCHCDAWFWPFGYPVIRINPRLADLLRLIRPCESRKTPNEDESVADDLQYGLLPKQSENRKRQLEKLHTRELP